MYASYFQWAAYLLRVCAVSSELRYSLIFIFLSVFIFYSNTNMSWVLPYIFQLGDVSYFDVFLSRHLSCVMFLVTLFETPPITFFFLSTHFLFLQFWKLPIYIGICISLVFAVFFPHLNTFSFALILKALRLFLTLFPPLILTAISLTSTDVCWTKYFEQLSSHYELLDIVVGQSSSNLFFI